MKGKLKVFRFSTRKRTVHVPCIAHVYEERVVYGALLSIRSETNETVKWTANLHVYRRYRSVSRIVKSRSPRSWNRTFGPRKARIEQIQIDYMVGPYWSAHIWIRLDVFRWGGGQNRERSTVIVVERETVVGG